MGSSDTQILVFDRAQLPSQPFIDVSVSAQLVRGLVDSSRWMSRRNAERSQEWVQPIPCALVREGDRFLALRRTRTTRSDLRSRVTLLAGGHIDFDAEATTYAELFERTLRRELSEEIGIQSLDAVRAVGIVVDLSSVASSRHVAFVYEVSIGEAVTVQAAEEFSLSSAFSSTFVERSKLPNFETRFDPWSRILCTDYVFQRVIATLSEGFTRQLSFPVSV